MLYESVRANHDIFITSKDHEIRQGELLLFIILLFTLFFFFFDWILEVLYQFVWPEHYYNNNYYTTKTMNIF